MNSMTKPKATPKPTTTSTRRSTSRKPGFTRASLPTEETDREDEEHGGHHKQDHDVPAYGPQREAFDHDVAHRVGQIVQRHGLDDRLDPGGGVVHREEDAREEHHGRADH